MKKVVGRKELISIIDLELFDIDAKVDTGADSNALHCDDIFIDADNFVHFMLLDKVHPSYHGKKMVMPLYKVKKVKSSNGVVQERASIKVDVEFFGKRYKTVVSLTDRSDMQYPMLIGRKFLSGKFLVDVSQEYLSCNKKVI
ncbi:MAG: clan AA aspartic protease [Epsilonproteobacteria bacterium]|nr:clan AA aspartic protease [Campylobacterota bacterium]OIO14839.1 MAG: clan AA aspartic protease [Helicobacteraceae bacterium CG1_02_36_14]PIP10927.1 MAG: clan AA aspartic protease [Sulfurimonas sp. CG23_combo_of_CG06-09_8_20_14_all_36_33]PIS26786.1 MAG: clan AA aspartic protease [Sulfurimonas sp. CG08_land_8_20_14_0_20_36_33]PIU35104.1 MAG: clan AA aspartic protease [Sulfurimonas sp. CG07_land_8_20_14_0_80_36_56]PIV03349.1 MAG: clan AA aspartic protease [Sulfurimonas sp. CG03_land_8_20_14_0